jgi:eukaryotic translation initiation factor 2C
MIRATTQKPRARKDQIEDAVRATLKYDSNEYLSSFGLRVEKEMMRIDTRVLPAPRVQFKDNDISGEGGVWNLRNARVIYDNVVGRRTSS